MLAKMKLAENQMYFNKKRSEAETILGIGGTYNPISEAFPQTKPTVAIAKLKEKDAKQTVDKDEKLLRQGTNLS